LTFVTANPWRSGYGKRKIGRRRKREQRKKLIRQNKRKGA